MSTIDRYTDTHTHTYHDISYDVVLTVVFHNTREWGYEAQDNAQLTLQRFELSTHAHKKQTRFKVSYTTQMCKEV